MVDTAIEVSVVIPTYREAANLMILVPRLAAALDRAGLRSEVIVVDDNSADGTEAICAIFAQSLPLQFFNRVEERGLASAVNHGLRNARGEILVVLDADLQHPPEAVPELVAACRSPFVDFAIGSRYIDGGLVVPAWSLFRRLNSHVASLLARGLTAARDPTSGFFAIKQSTFAKANGLNPLGYKIGLELIVRCDCRRIVELPISFHDRFLGRSKLSFYQRWQYLRQITRLYWAKYSGPSQVIRFGLVGVSGTIVDVLSFSLLLPLAPLWFSRLVAIGCAMIWNFALHRRVTFRSVAPRGFVRPFATFCAACLVGATINGAVSVALCAYFNVFKSVPVLAAVFGVLGGAASNYGLCRRWVFQETTIVDAHLPNTKPPTARHQPRDAA
jgi:dolichol-phosphate mannosyltransferase